MSAPAGVRAMAMASTAIVLVALASVSASTGRARAGEASADGESGEARGPSAAEDYMLHCSACHTLGGDGTSEIPTLRGLGELLESPQGRRYVARVPGVAQAPLDDERLARLLNWMFATFSQVEAGFSAAEVGPLRAQPLRDPRAARAALP